MTDPERGLVAIWIALIFGAPIVGALLDCIM